MIRMSKTYIETKWSTGEPIKLRKKIYRVGHMSYGDYFLEEKKDWNRSETNYHSDDTLWLKKELKNGIFTGTYFI